MHSYDFVTQKDNYFRTVFKLIVEDKRQVPMLVLYSKVDKLLAAEEIEENLKKRKSLYPNLMIKSKMYPDAEHVMIYQKYPEDYLKHVKEHIEFCKLDLATVLKEHDLRRDLIPKSKL